MRAGSVSSTSDAINALEMYELALSLVKSALDAAEQLIAAKTLPEAAQLQARFLQTQMTVLGEQGNALIELSLKVAKETADTWIKAATNTVGDLKNAAA